jgi:hypothetical protein
VPVVIYIPTNSPHTPPPHPGQHLLFLFFFLVVLGLELKVYALSHSTSPFFLSFFFVMGFLEIGFHKLFALAGFEL